MIIWHVRYSLYGIKLGDFILYKYRQTCFYSLMSPKIKFDCRNFKVNILLFQWVRVFAEY